MPGKTLDGKQYGKLFICLQEKDNQFGPKILEEVKYQKFCLNLINTKIPENPGKSRKIANDPFELPIIVVTFSVLPKFTENSNPQKFLFYLLII
jgi:hypothetical protein